MVRSYGLSGLRAHIRKGVTLGNLFADLVRSRKDLFEIVTTPAFGLTVLRVKSGKGSVGEAPVNVNGETNGDGVIQKTTTSSTVLSPDPASTALTREIYETINARGEIYLTSSVVAGVYVIRQVCGSPMAEEKNARRAFEILVEVTEQVRAKGVAN